MKPILDLLADHYGTTTGRILTVRNAHPETDARQVLCWYLHQWEGVPIKELAIRLGWSETTIGYGVRQVCRRLSKDPALRRLCLDVLRQKVAA